MKVVRITREMRRQKSIPRLMVELARLIGARYQPDEWALCSSTDGLSDDEALIFYWLDDKRHEPTRQKLADYRHALIRGESPAWPFNSGDGA